MNQECPLVALRSGQWFKLICGASYQYLPAIRNLSLVYTLAGAHCIDVAADPAVITSAREGIDAARTLDPDRSPWLMVSLNSGEDLHFRKAIFNAQHCLPQCSQPCKTLCPAEAISLGGVLSDRCYGCGRCLPVCPIGIIDTYEQTYPWQNLVDLPIDALEIHTQSDRIAEFATLWKELGSWIPHLKAISVSFPDHDRLQENLQALLAQMHPAPPTLIWQTDGRPMSGDIGEGTTHAALRLGEKVSQMQLPRGYIQLAGGTNHTTADKVRERSLAVHGVAYGSYARSLLQDILSQVPEGKGIESFPLLLGQALNRAKTLTAPLKTLSPPHVHARNVA